MAQDSPQAKHSEQNVLNNVYETTLRALATLNVGYTGSATQLPRADAMAIKVTESGTTTYVAYAAPGSSQASAVWQVMKIDESSGTVITWADGDAEFNNVATDLTSITYS